MLRLTDSMIKPIWGKKKSLTNGSSNSNTESVFRVKIPEGINPGDEFSIYAHSSVIRVRCPPDSRPGQSIKIKIPITKNNSDNNSGPKNTPSLHPLDSPNVKHICDPNNKGRNAGYIVIIPEGVIGGEDFTVTIQRQQLSVTCPKKASPGMSIRIFPSLSSDDVTSFNTIQPSSSFKNQSTQLFEVEIPNSVQPGQPFALMAGGARVLVTCPANASPGKRIRFNVPLAITHKPEATNEISKIKLKYNKDGWERIIRSDMKFQWVRVDNKGEVEGNFQFDVDKSAYVRRLDFQSTGDPKIYSCSTLDLVQATEGVVDSKITFGDNNEDFVTYSHIVNAQVKSFAEKSEWFYDTCNQLRVHWDHGHMRMNVRRQFLLRDSVDAVMSLSKKDLRKVWRFEFIGEAAMDAGGLTREWFQLVSEEIFDPDKGLWKSSMTNQMCMEINPASEFYHEDHLLYYNFLGRVIGKALFDRQLVSGHMVQYLYKHILGWPITFSDLEQIDQDIYRNLKHIETMSKNGDNIDLLYLDFTTTKDILGQKVEVELVEGGANIEVTDENYHKYLEAILKYRMLECVKPQMKELLLGFFDVIPEPLLTIFDFQELELLLCGLPKIDMDDWKAHTEYSGEYSESGFRHVVCKWFWEIVTDFSQEMRVRLLQFVTGTSGVPAQGFGVLQSNDGNFRRFTINGVALGVCLYPRAHTCFNRIDLPLYESKDELSQRLKLAVTMASTGFDIE